MTNLSFRAFLPPGTIQMMDVTCSPWAGLVSWGRVEPLGQGGGQGRRGPRASQRPAGMPATGSKLAGRRAGVSESILPVSLDFRP